MEHIIILVTIVSLLGCAHPPPREWWPSTQIQMMGECRVMCKDGVYSYESISGTCSCQEKRK